MYKKKDGFDGDSNFFHFSITAVVICWQAVGFPSVRETDREKDFNMVFCKDWRNLPELRNVTGFESLLHTEPTYDFSYRKFLHGVFDS